MTNLWHWILPTVTRSLSKKLSEEPFKVPYPVASTASTPVEEVYAAKIIFNIFSSTNLYVFVPFFCLFHSIFSCCCNSLCPILPHWLHSNSSTQPFLLFFSTVLLQVAFSLLVLLWPIGVKPIVVKQSVTPSLLSMFPASSTFYVVLLAYIIHLIHLYYLSLLFIFWKISKT